MRKIVVIAHDIRSAHNVGSLMRTAEGLGIDKLYLTGYTPYPFSPGDKRLPHIARKLTQQIRKTALGAEEADFWEHHENLIGVIENLNDEGYAIVGLEQVKSATPLHLYKPPQKVAILLGREVEGIATELQKICDEFVEIPMRGRKESFNVVEAATMAMYHCQNT